MNEIFLWAEIIADKTVNRFDRIAHSKMTDRICWSFVKIAIGFFIGYFYFRFQFNG